MTEGADIERLMVLAVGLRDASRRYGASMCCLPVEPVEAAEAALREALVALLQRAAKAETALAKINEIRNSIVGFQTINWSEHIYPLVAALEEAGIAGMQYEDAREKFGTMLDRTLAAEVRAEKAEQDRDEAQELVKRLTAWWEVASGDGADDSAAEQAWTEVLDALDSTR